VFSLFEGNRHYAEANVSTEQSTPRQDARISRAHGHQKRAAGAEAASREGPQTPESVALLMNHAPATAANALPKRRRISARSDFQKVYAEGQRYDGRLMAAFLRANNLVEHRIGVTASTKAIGKSVDRNRAKRLLRELFRRNQSEIGGLKRNYDWVLNGKRALLSSTEELRFREFRRIVEQVGRDEREE
jgi:ribonuclease P protein component